MPGENDRSECVPEDRGRALLDFAHQRLLTQPADGAGLGELLADLARAGGATGGGFASLASDDTPAVRHRVPAGERAVPPGRWPWEEQPDLLARLRAAPAGLSVRTGDGTGWLLALVGQPGEGHGLLWLERPGEPDWSAAEGAALALTGHALVRLVETGTAAWARQLERALRQQRLEDVAVVVRRLAHDFGNVLTSILGFTELSLGVVQRGTSLHGYLQEVYRGTQQGADLTARLRDFSRRGTAPQAATSLGLVLAAEAERLRADWGPAVQFELYLPPDLPPVRVEADLLRQALLPVLENAREAIAGEGTVTVAARVTELSQGDCVDLLGNPRPGPCVEVTVTDTGCGLSPEAGGRLLAEPFVTTKPRHRGLGLATVYGVLHVHRGGFRLGPAPGGGTAARLYLPRTVAVVETTAAGRAPAAGGRGERVLVVDDDPLILRLVCTTLERAGYRVQPAGGGAEALEAFTAPTDEPFRLVVSDVLMPHMSGVDLARRLLHLDACVNLLFLSGYVSAEFARENVGNWNFNLLQKPFRAEGLLRAVRTALDRGPRPVPAASPEAWA